MTTSIHFLESAQQFHLSNGQISYIFKVSDDGKLLHLYYGKNLPDAAKIGRASCRERV